MEIVKLNVVCVLFLLLISLIKFITRLLYNLISIMFFLYYIDDKNSNHLFNVFVAKLFYA